MTLVSRDHHETAYAVLAHFLTIAQRAPLIFASVRAAGAHTLKPRPYTLLSLIFASVRRCGPHPKAESPLSAPQCRDDLHALHAVCIE